MRRLILNASELALMATTFEAVPSTGLPHDGERSGRLRWRRLRQGGGDVDRGAFSLAAAGGQQPEEVVLAFL